MSAATTIEREKRRKQLGRKIVAARESAGLNQRELAERLVDRLIQSKSDSGSRHRDIVSMQRSLRRYENGHNEPRGEMLIAIAAETGAETSHFTSNGDESDDEEEPLQRIATELVRRGENDLAIDLLNEITRMRDTSAPLARELA